MSPYLLLEYLGIKWQTEDSWSDQRRFLLGDLDSGALEIRQQAINRCTDRRVCQMQLRWAGNGAITEPAFKI